MSEHVHVTTRALLESAVRKLGPERSEQALRAFAPGHFAGGWNSCPLACSYGPDGELEEALAGVEDVPDVQARVAAPLVGISSREAVAFIDAYDFRETSDGRAAGALLYSLLVAEAAKMLPPPAPRAVPEGAARA